MNVFRKTHIPYGRAWNAVKPIAWSVVVIVIASASTNADDKKDSRTSQEGNGNVRTIGDDHLRAGQPPDQTDDILCSLLFDNYLRGAKINTDDVNAAIQLVASRGRHTGFWRTVLAEFELSFDSEDWRSRSVGRNSLAVLSKMLGNDGATRWEHAQRQRGVEMPPSAIARSARRLGPEVLDRVIARGRQADSHSIDSYVMAVRNAHDPRGNQFLLDVLHNPHDSGRGLADIFRGSWQDAQFHAAIGLAELGNQEGVKWLIAQSESADYRKALADLTGQPATMNKTQWEHWWMQNKNGFVPVRRVSLRSP